MKCFSFAGSACMLLLAFLLLTATSSYSQCIITVDARENITTNTIEIAGAKTRSIASNNINIGFINQGNGSKLTLNFSGNNNTYANDTIRFVGSMTVESISRGNNNLNGVVFVVTQNADITFKNIDINNSNNIKFINYGLMTFENSFTMPGNTIFVNKLAASVLTFKTAINFANNANITVIYSNGGIINFLNGFTLQSNNRMCLTGYTRLNTTTIINNVANSIYVPASFSACIRYTSSVNLNNTITNGPGHLYVAQAPGASSASNASRWGSSIVNTNSNGCNIILPVKLIDFYVTEINKTNVLKWTTATEYNSQRFDVEKSIDGINFVNIGSVKAKGYSTDKVQYGFTDKQVNESVKYYYRIKMVDINEQYNYSGIMLINTTGTGGRLIASAAQGKLFTRFAPVENNSFLIITDVTGNLIIKKSLTAGDTGNITDTHSFVHGNYFVVLVTGNKKETVQVIL